MLPSWCSLERMFLLHSGILKKLLMHEIDVQAQCGDPYVEKAIEDKINQFYAWVEKHPRKKGQVVLAFFEKRKTQRWSLIGGKQEERLFWEQWWACSLPLHVLQLSCIVHCSLGVSCSRRFTRGLSSAYCIIQSEGLRPARLSRLHMRGGFQVHQHLHCRAQHQPAELFQHLGRCAPPIAGCLCNLAQTAAGRMT